MTGADVLVLHGSPGSGKSTLARAVAEILREADVPHAVIDIDELSLIHPHPGRPFGTTNLAAIWPHYTAVANLRVIIPTVVADHDDLARLRAATPGRSFVVCELTAPRAVLHERVRAREPNEFWQERLRAFVDHHARRTDLATIRDFTVSTHDRPIKATAREILDRAGWPPSHPPDAPAPDLDSVDLVLIGMALGDQDAQTRWYYRPDTKEVVAWTDTSDPEDDPEELDVDVRWIEPIPTRVWYRDMASFAEQLSDPRTARSLTQALQGRGSFRRFKDALHTRHPDLVPTWNAFHEARTRRRVMEWLADNAVITPDAAARLAAEHPDPPLP